jgi:hypothetical protein
MERNPNREAENDSDEQNVPRFYATRSIITVHTGTRDWTHPEPGETSPDHHQKIINAE